MTHGLHLAAATTRGGQGPAPGRRTPTYMQDPLPLPELDTTSRACQRWRDRGLSWQYADPSERFDARRYEVHELDEAIARAYVIRMHYLASYPAAARRYGLYRARELVGAAAFSIPSQAAVLTNYLPGLEPYRESLELGRFCLSDSEPGNAESWFLARCFNDFLLPTGVRGVVSFADPVQRTTADGTITAIGHVGWIYQATGAVYTGRGTARTIELLPDGRTLNPRTQQKIRAQERGHEYAEQQLIAFGARPMRADEDPARWLEEALRDIGVRYLRHAGCHRYVFALGRSRRERRRVEIAMPAQPYPKRIDPVLRHVVPPRRASIRTAAGNTTVHR